MGLECFWGIFPSKSKRGSVLYNLVNARRSDPGLEKTCPLYDSTCQRHGQRESEARLSLCICQWFCYEKDQGVVLGETDIFDWQN